MVQDIRATLWRRLLVNISGSVVCMLVERPVSVVSEVPAISDLFARLSREGAAVALANGVDVERGAVPAGAVYRFPGHHKPSMLQDYERGRTMEIEGILMTPIAFARKGGVETPAMDVVAALASARAAGKRLYSG